MILRNVDTKFESIRRHRSLVKNFQVDDTKTPEASAKTKLTDKVSGTFGPYMLVHRIIILLRLKCRRLGGIHFRVPISELIAAGYKNKEISAEVR